LQEYCDLHYYITESKVQKCSHIKLQTGNQQVIALVDSGSDICVLLEELFDKLNYSAFIEAFIPTTRAIVILPWDGRTLQIRKESFVPSDWAKTWSNGCSLLRLTCWQIYIRRGLLE
jgi:hypothetical protein